MNGPANKRGRIEEGEFSEFEEGKSFEGSLEAMEEEHSQSTGKNQEESAQEQSHVELIVDDEHSCKNSGKEQELKNEQSLGEETANPFALLRLDSSAVSPAACSSSDQNLDSKGDRPKKIAGGSGKEIERNTSGSQCSLDVDSGIETFDDAEMIGSPSKSVSLFKLARLRKLLERVFALYPRVVVDAASSDDQTYHLDIPAAVSRINTASLNTFTENEELADFLQNLLMDVLNFLTGDSGILALDGSQGMHQDSLSCSPSGERANFGSFSSMFLRQHSMVFADLHCVEGSLELKIFNYLLTCYDRLRSEENKPNLEETEKNCLNQLWLQLLSHTALLLQGYVTGEENEKTRVLLLRGLLAQSLPYGFVEDLLKYADTDPETFESIFEPVLHGILRAGTVCSLVNDDYRQPLSLLLEMCEMKSVGSNKRPVCSLLVKRKDWLPAPVSKAAGREIGKLSFLGPFFSLSVFPEEGNVDVAEKYFQSADVMPDETATLVYQTMRANLELLRGDLHKILHAVLVNAGSRSQALKYIAEVIRRNDKKAQMQANDILVATDGFMLNFLSVMYLLSSKVTLDKVNLLYPFSTNTRLDLKDATRLRLDSEEAKKFEESLERNFDAKFPTECFFLTVHAQHLAIMPALNRHAQRMRALNEMKSQLKKWEQSRDEESLSPERRARLLARIANVKAMIERLTKSKHCAAAALLDELLLSRALNFISQQLGLLINAVFWDSKEGYPENTTSRELALIPEEASKLFQAYPEFYLEDALDFLIYLERNAPQILIDSCPFDLPYQILLFICNTQYVKSPFLAAKCVEVLFYMCPQVMPQATGFHTTILNHPMASEKLFRSLMKFYSDVESTGSHTEFFDKFTFRRNVQVIMESLWKNALHRHIMIEQCRECGGEFVRFVNMLINDTTFLLDESLHSFRRIHNTEELMKNEPEWNALAREEQRRHRGVLEQDEMHVRSWLQLAHQTVDTFGYLTEHVPEPFLTENLGDRLAAMLNYNVKDMCGPKYMDLKVQNPQKYGWQPRKLLNQLTDIYLHLAHSDKFAEYIASDERSYSKDLFDDMVGRLLKSGIKPESQIEALKLLGDRAFEIWKENLKEETDWGEIPEEFLDPVMGTLMRNPVDLPSGHTMDKKIIKRHLLSTPEDPFSRMPLTEDQLVENKELKKKIGEWMQKKRSETKK